MSSQALDLSVLQGAEILVSFMSHSAPAADKSSCYGTALPSPSPSVREYYRTFASARKSTADHACSSSSPSKTLPTPRSSRRSTGNRQSLIEDREVTSNHASSSTSLSRNLLTAYTSPCPSVDDVWPTSLAQQHRPIEIPERMWTQKSSDDLTDDEEGATTTTTTRDIICHGNTYLNLVPHAGSACWELTRQIDPASIGVQPKSGAPTLEDHNGESHCPRCRIFQRSRTAAFARSSSERESTVPLTEDAQDCIEDQRTGAAEYDDDYHENHRYKLRRDQLKRRQRYIVSHVMKPETRVRREAERAARLEQQREAPFERAYEEIRLNRDVETARIRAENKAEYDREKAIAEARPMVSFERYVASLPTPDPKRLEAYTRAFVPTNDMIRPPHPANVSPPATVARKRTPAARVRHDPKPKPTPHADPSPPTNNTPSPPTQAPVPTTPAVPPSKKRKAPTTPLPPIKKRKPPTLRTTPVPAKKKSKGAAVHKPPPPLPTRSSPRTKKPDGRNGEGIALLPALQPLAAEKVYVDQGVDAAYENLRASGKESGVGRGRRGVGGGGGCAEVGRMGRRR